MTKTILITGTSSGYGKTTAKLFLDRGWNVLATMRRPDAAVFPQSERLKLLPLDIADKASVAAVAQEAASVFGSIDVLVNNAGIGLASAVEATPDDTIHEIFETNSFGTFAMCRSIIPQMRHQGHGVIVNVTSSVAIGVMPMVAIYAASKWAVEGFTESLAYELEPFGIKARLVQPGYAPTTSFTANGGERMAGLIPPAYGAIAQACFERMADYPTAYCSEVEVAEAVFAAATDGGPRLRYPAGPDSEMLSTLRWSLQEEEYAAAMRDMFAPRLGAD